MSIRMHKQTVFSDNSCHGILYSKAKIKYCYIQQLGESHNHYAEWKKPGREEPILCASIDVKSKER